MPPPGGERPEGPSDPAPGPVMSASPATVLECAAAVAAGRAPGPAAMATVVGRKGSAPQVEGAKLLLRADGAVIGTVGGGALEARTLDLCRSVLREPIPVRKTFHLVRDLAMCCGGTVDVFVEPVRVVPRLVVIGAGHVGRALAVVARAAGWAVTVVDDRDDLLAVPELSGCDRRSADADEVAAALSDLRAGDHVVIVTRDHRRDELALDALLDRPLAYLGMIGSRRKVHAVLARILARRQATRRSLPALDHVHAPIGLDIGGDTPGEIAVAVAAELLALRNGKQVPQRSIVPEVLARLAGEQGSSRDDAHPAASVRAPRAATPKSDTC